jgi:hypothetical protein
MVGLGLAGCAERAPRPAGAVLSETKASPEAVAEAVLAALADGDREALQRLALTEEEFTRAVWPELPSSRPERNLTVDYVWGDLNQKSRGFLQTLLNEHGGQRYRLVSVDFDGGVTEYETFRVHRDSRVTVEDAAGERRDVRLFGSVLEADGRYKLLSYVID